MQKIKNLEFLRVIGCLSIIFLHLFSNTGLHLYFSDIDLYNKFYHMTNNGQKAVDLFFILSGFFFVLKLDTAKSIWEFIKNKLIRLYPVLIFITIICFIASLFGAIKFTLYDNILGLLYLNGTGLVNHWGNISISWYVSTMLWVLVFYFYLLKNYKKSTVNIIIAIIIMFCYSYLIHAKGGKINNNIQTFDYIYNVAMMRGLAGIGIGYFIGEWYKSNIDKIKNFTVSFLGKVSLTGLEFVCLYFIINNLMLHKLKFANDIIYIIAFTVIIILFLLRKGFISQILENDFWINLSKYTYSFYMTHIIVRNILKGSFWKYNGDWIYANPVLNIMLTLGLIFAVGIFTYHFVEKTSATYFKNLCYNNKKEV